MNDFCSGTGALLISVDPDTLAASKSSALASDSPARSRKLPIKAVRSWACRHHRSFAYMPCLSVGKCSVRGRVTESHGSEPSRRGYNPFEGYVVTGGIAHEDQLCPWAQCSFLDP